MRFSEILSVVTPSSSDRSLQSPFVEVISIDRISLNAAREYDQSFNLHGFESLVVFPGLCVPITGLLSLSSTILFLSHICSSLGAWWEEYYLHLMPSHVSIVFVRRESSEWRHVLLDLCNTALPWHSTSSLPPTPTLTSSFSTSSIDTTTSSRLSARRRQRPQTQVNIAMNYVARHQPDHIVSRQIEAYVSLRSMAYYRSCPVTVHLITNSEGMVGFRELEQRLFPIDSVPDPKSWHVSDMAVHGNNGTGTSPSSVPNPPPLYFNYINVEDHPVAAYVFHQGKRQTTYSRIVDSLTKIANERLLPADLDRVIYLDFDSLVVRDICEVWNEVWTAMEKRAQETGVLPMFGLAPEMHHFYNIPLGRYMTPPTDSVSLVPERWVGVNGGVVVTDLRAVREGRWSMMWMRTVLDFVNNVPIETTDPNVAWTNLFVLAEQNIINFAMKRHPERLCLLSNDINFIFHTIGKPNGDSADLYPSVVQRVMPARGHSIAIFHGCGEQFLADESIKRDLWLLFYDRDHNPPVYRKKKKNGGEEEATANESFAKVLSPRELAHRRSRESIVKYLQEWRRL